MIFLEPRAAEAVASEPLTDEQREQLIEELVQDMDRAFDLGGPPHVKRDELYNRHDRP